MKRITTDINSKVYVLYIKRTVTTVFQEVKGEIFQNIPKQVSAECFMRGIAQRTQFAFM
jgi:hypothetical protein